MHLIHGGHGARVQAAEVVGAAGEILLTLFLALDRAARRRALPFGARTFVVERGESRTQRGELGLELRELVVVLLEREQSLELGIHTDCSLLGD